MSLLWERPSWLCAPRPGPPGPPPQALQCPGAQTRHEAGHPVVGSSGVWAQDPQERAPPKARAWTVLRDLEQKAPVGQAWGDSEKGPETTRKVAEASQSLCRPLTLTLGAGGPADPAPSWPAQRLPPVGLPPWTLRARPGEGGGQSGTSSPTVSSESFCARAQHVPRRQQHPPGWGVAVLWGEWGQDRLGRARPSAQGCTQPGQAGGGLRGHIHHEGRTGRQGRAPWGSRLHRARAR